MWRATEPAFLSWKGESWGRPGEHGRAIRTADTKSAAAHPLVPVRSLQANLRTYLSDTAACTQVHPAFLLAWLPSTTSLRLPVCSLDVHADGARSELRCVCVRSQTSFAAHASASRDLPHATAVLRRDSASRGASCGEPNQQKHRRGWRTRPCRTLWLKATSPASESKTRDALCAVRMPGYSVEWERAQ